LSEIFTTFASKLFFELPWHPPFVAWSDDHAGMVAKKMAFVKKIFLHYITFEKFRNVKKHFLADSCSLLGQNTSISVNSQQNEFSKFPKSASVVELGLALPIINLLTGSGATGYLTDAPVRPYPIKSLFLSSACLVSFSTSFANQRAMRYCGMRP